MEKVINNSLAFALDYATKKHKGQFRRDGSEYIVHPQRVANYVFQFKKSKNIEALIISAYLHDTIEDTDTTFYEIAETFGPQVASLVLELTTDNDMRKELGKTKYLSIKMKNMSSWALVVKLCDRLDNISDLKTATPEFQKRYSKETFDIIEYLLNNRKLSKTHMNIIKCIVDKLSWTRGNDYDNLKNLVEAKCA